MENIERFCHITSYGAPRGNSIHKILKTAFLYYHNDAFSIFFQYLSLLIPWNAYACKTGGYPGYMENIARSCHITSYGAHRGKFYPRNLKIAILLLLGHFQYFFQYLSLLIPWNALACKTGRYPSYKENIGSSCHITLYGAHTGKFYPRNLKIAILLLLGHFQYFFQYLNLLIP